MKSTVLYENKIAIKSVVRAPFSSLSSNILKTESDRTVQFTQAYKEYFPALLRFCVFKLSNREKAIDIVQETYIKTWQYFLKGNTISNDKSFLYTTAHNLIVDEYRRRKNVSLEIIMNTQEEPRAILKEEVYSQEDITHVMGIVATLPVRYRSVLLMRYVDDFSVKEIAEIL